VRITPFIAAATTLAAAAVANPAITVRYDAFVPANPECPVHRDVDGVATLRYNQPTGTKLNLVMHGLCPNTIYSVAVATSNFDGTWTAVSYRLQAFQPTPVGVGTFHTTFGTPPVGDEEIVIFVDNGNPNDADLIDATEARAFAFPRD
jgi:hypothetical protein